MMRFLLRQGGVAALCAVAAAALASSTTEAQNAERSLQHVAEVHIKPGGLPVFEAAHAVRNDRLEQAGLSFPVRSAVSESLVYRFVSPVRDWAGLGKRAEEMGRLPAAPAGSPDGNSAIDHVDSYLRWSRPDLGYLPEDQRLEVSEWQAMQLIRIYVQQGKMGDVGDALRDAAALYKRHGVRERFAVYTRGIGADAPVVEIQVWGSSMADLYQTADRLQAQLGAEMDQLRARVGAAARRIEVSNFTIRRDMGFQPAN